MKKTSAFPSLVDIRCLANPDLIGMVRFCQSEVKRLARVASKAKEIELREATNFLSQLDYEMSARSLSCPA